MGSTFLRPVDPGQPYGAQTFDSEAFDSAYTLLAPAKPAATGGGRPAYTPETAKAALQAAGKPVTQANIDYLVSGGKKYSNQASGKVTPAK